MASEFVKPVGQLREFFTQAAHAVVSTQEQLESRPLSSPPAPADVSAEMQPAYVIPRTEVGLSFGLDVRNAKRVIIPFLRKNDGRLQRHGHELKFSLVAVPAPPAPLPAQPDIQPAPTNIPTTLIYPHFLLPSPEQDDLCARLAKAMLAGKWDFAYPERGPKPSQKQVSKEANKIRETLESNDDPERGMIVLRLDAATPTYLIVRVTDKSEKDGLFVFCPEQTTEALIYSFEGDGIENIRYRALHELSLTIRHWLAGAPPLRLPFKDLRAPFAPANSGSENSGSELGLAALGEFTQALTEGYVSGLRYLSWQDTPANAEKLFPPYFDLTGVRAELTYSVYFDEEERRLRFSFGGRKRPDGADVDDEVSVIESRVAIRAYRADDNLPRVDVELVAPEFALSGGARELVLSAAVRSAESIARQFEAGDASLYLQFLESDSHQREVVILLSYKGKVPQRKFLFVWPGIYQGRPRDFVFTCELQEGEIKEDSVRRVMSLEQELDPVGGTIGVEITNEQYQPFHNVFHAVRLWRSRIGA